MEKLLGILPYIYLCEEPVQLGEITLMGVPDLHGRNHYPSSESDWQSLRELWACFPTRRGLRTNKGAVRALTYFLLSNVKGREEEALTLSREAITLLRYTLLRPDSQTLGNIESTYLYAFALPPTGSAEYRTYLGWANMNRVIWISPKHDKYYPPDPHVDMELIYSSQLEDIAEVTKRFYDEKMSDGRRQEVLLALKWYNQSFLGYSIRELAGRSVDIATAFETLFQLPRRNKAKEFKKRTGECLKLQDGSVLDKWASDFYDQVRSETVHRGEPTSLLFKHPEAQLGHLSFLWSAQRIFRECVAAEIGLPRHIPNERLLTNLLPTRFT